MPSSAEQDHDFFEAIPWCRAVLRDLNFIARPVSWRQPKKPLEETLFSRTLNSEGTIGACVSLYKRPAPGVAYVDEFRTLLSLGSDLDGHPQICHGGIIATIMDEVMGMLLSVNKELGYPEFNGDSVTAYLNTTYLKPLKTPQIFLVTARLGSIEGRKLFTEASIVGGDQAVLAKAEALFIKLKEPAEVYISTILSS